MPDTAPPVGDDRRRFEALYNAHAQSVLAYALRRTDRATADDVLSDVFLVAWRRLGDVPAEPRPWLLGTARKVLANHRRSQSRRDALRDQLLHQPSRGSTDPADAPVVDGALLRALAALRDDDREALLLVAWDGLTPREAAQVVGAKPPAFTMRLSRARKRLAALLEHDAAEPPTQASAEADSAGRHQPVAAGQRTTGEVRDA